MAKQISLKAKTRASHGKNAIKKLRDGGSLPGVVYGKKTAPVSIELNVRDVKAALSHATSENLLVDLQVENNGKVENRLTILQEVQHDYLFDRLLHVDFHEIASDEKLNLEVPVEAEGEAVGVKTGGGLLEHVLRTLHIECLPKDIPDVITVDVSALEIGQAIHVSDIKAPAGVVITSQKELPVFSCVAPKAEEAATATAEVKEVEVIKEKKPAEGEAAKADAKPEAKKDAKK